MNTFNKPYLRKLIGCQDGDFTSTTVWVDCGVTRRGKSALASQAKEASNAQLRLKPRKPLTDSLVEDTLQRYEHLGYEDIPTYLRVYLSTRRDMFHRRSKTSQSTTNLNKHIAICKKALSQGTADDPYGLLLAAKHLKRYEQAQARLDSRIYYVNVVGRTPNATEREETVIDYHEHRHMNNEMTVSDYLNKYRNV